MFLTIMNFSFFLLRTSISAAIEPGLSSSNVLCVIAIIAILYFNSFEQISHCQFVTVTVNQQIFPMSCVFGVIRGNHIGISTKSSAM